MSQRIVCGKTDILKQETKKLQTKLWICRIKNSEIFKKIFPNTIHCKTKYKYTCVVKHYILKNF